MKNGTEETKEKWLGQIGTYETNHLFLLIHDFSFFTILHTGLPFHRVPPPPTQFHNRYHHVLSFITLFVHLVSLGESSGTSLGRDRNNLHGDLEAQGLDHLGGLGVNLQLAVSGVRQVQSRNLGDVLVLSLSLLLLQLERDASDGTLLNSLHQVGGVTGNLVSQLLGLDDSDLRGQSLVGLEVEGQLGVESLNEHLGGSLHGLSSDTALCLLACVWETDATGCAVSNSTYHICLVLVDYDEFFFTTCSDSYCAPRAAEP